MRLHPFESSSGDTHHAKTNVCVLLIVIRKGEYDMSIYKKYLDIHTDAMSQWEGLQHTIEYDQWLDTDEAYILQEFQDALDDNDMERASQLASLIEITIQ